MKPFDFPFTPFHNYILDHIMPSLAPNSWKVLCVAIRQTLGWVDKNSPTGRKEWDQISYGQFMEKTGIGSKETLSKALKECIGNGYLIRVAVGTHPGTRTKIFAYSLNRDFEISGTETVLGAGTETVLGAGTETVLGAGTETVLTKETKKQRNGDGDVLTAEQQSIFYLLSDFGVSENVAMELSQQCSLEHVKGWIDYTYQAENLQSPVGFLISKLRSGESVPRSAVRSEESEREKRYQYYTGGKYADLVQH